MTGIYDLLTLGQAERLWTKIAICEHGDTCEECCWLWTGGKHNDGYGWIRIGTKETKSTAALAHRVIYALTRGDFSPDLCVCHTCDNTACCNPAHLWLGTQADNLADMVQKGRQAKGEYAGNTKLTTPQIHRIRRLGTYMYHRVIAKRFGVATPTITVIINRRQWKHI